MRLKKQCMVGAPIQGTGHGTIVHRRYRNKPIDHVYIACLECRFSGSWDFDSALFYRAVGDDAEVRLVELNGTRKVIPFKEGAHVTLLPTNVLTYEREDEREDSVYVDEDEQAGRGKNKTVID